MARVVLISPDPRRAGPVAAALRALGHRVDGRRSTAAALRVQADLYVASTELPPDALGRARAPVAWFRPEGAEAGEHPADRTLDADAGEARWRVLLEGLLPRSLEWSGLEFLRTIDGPVSRYSLLRAFFLAYRTGATGRFELTEAGRWSADLREGTVVAVRGVGGLLAGLGVEGTEEDDLEALLGRAIAAGHAPDEALRAAARGLGRTVARATLDGAGRVRFVEGAAPEGFAAPLPVPVPRMLAEGLAAERPARVVRRAYARRRRAAVRVNVPADAPEHRLGLPPRVLGLLRQAGHAETLGELVSDPRRGETDEAWLAVDLLVHLGLVETAEPETPAEAPASALSDALPPETGDPREAALEAALADIEGKEPWEVLGITSSRLANEGAVNRSFVERSAEFHPDRYVDASPRARALAERCFAAVQAAREALRGREAIEELAERLLAAEEGRPYVSARERAAARLLAKKGEVAFKKRDWTEATRQFREAARRDPTEWTYRFRALHAAWLAGEADADETVEALLALEGPAGRKRAEVLFAAGEVRVKQGREDAAMALFRQVVELDEEHVGARRYLRLHEMRRQRQAGQRGGLFGLFRKR